MEQNLYQYIKHKVKPDHHELVNCYMDKKVDCLISYYTKKWGSPAKDSPFRYPIVEFNEAVNKPTLLSYLITERMIIKSMGLYKNLTIGFFGSGGTGKTTYSILSGIQALVMMGYPLDKAIEMTASLTLFDAETTINFFENLIKERQWVPFIIIDDVGAQISKYWIFLRKLYWAQYFSVLDHVKDWCGVLILTAKHEKRAPAGMRDIIDLVVRSSETDVSGYDGKIYTMTIMEFKTVEPSSIEFLDIFPSGLKMPDKIWSKMMEIRSMMGEERIKKIKEELEKEKATPKHVEKRRKRGRGEIEDEENDDEEIEGVDIEEVLDNDAV